jgi:hypothetical protein
MTTPVRPEYEDMAIRFFELGAHFERPFDEPTRNALLVAIRAFEAIDRHVDTIPAAIERRTAFEHVKAALEGRGQLTDATLDRTVAALRDALGARCATFVAAMAEFFEHTERLRSTQQHATYIRSVLGEARATATMTFAAVPAIDTDMFARFFVRLAEVANLVDKLHDVRADYRAREIAIRPGLRLHVAIAGNLAVRAAVLALRSPMPLALVRWGLPFLVRSQRSDLNDVVESHLRVHRRES